jgi:hypothetical protein
LYNTNIGGRALLRRSVLVSDKSQGTLSLQFETDNDRDAAREAK